MNEKLASYLVKYIYARARYIVPKKNNGFIFLSVRVCALYVNKIEINHDETLHITPAYPRIYVIRKISF